ncbi:growth-regulating factor 12-like [Typha angustifolia]|uniref:growth-regulating factor 12-like n=1 Tax=Typha angustifolia TaxID=59011 RepID=UPI003C2B6381
MALVESKTAEEEQYQNALPPPSKVPRLSSDSNSGVVTMAASSPLLLGLGLGLGASPASCSQKRAFTFMQLQELEHQALIYKYMAAGVPVPVHLVLPIWKSVAASSFGPHHYPSLMGFASLCLDYRNSMEPEPGRCRRTDGKKWRCSRDVVPDQKYCERHMHRGRNRSRKPVEVAGGGGVAAIVQDHMKDHVNGTNSSISSGTQLSISVATNGLKLTPSATNGSVSNSSSSSNNVSPPRLGFSPTSVLNVCKTGPI